MYMGTPRHTFETAAAKYVLEGIRFSRRKPH